MKSLEEIGDDIRNNLTAPQNLISLLKVYFEDPKVDKEILKNFILREMNQTTVSIEYLSKLL